MKLTKHKLTEAIDPEINDINPSTASTSEIADVIQQSAELVGKEVSDSDAEANAKEVKATADIINADNFGGDIDVANEVANDPEATKDEVIFTKNRLTDKLDHCLRVSQRNFRQYRGKEAPEGENLLVEGLPGSGKTGIVYSWAKANNVHIVYLNAKDNDIEAFLNGFTVRDADDPHKAGKIFSYSTNLGELEKDNAILFLDEFNRAQDLLRGSLLTLINEKYVAGPEEGNRHYFKKLLFTIACINPPVKTDRGASKLNDAEKTRFAVTMRGDKGFDSNSETADDYFHKYYDMKMLNLDPADPYYNEDLEQFLRTQYLGVSVVNHPDFAFDGRNKLDDLAANDKNMLNQRHLTAGLKYCGGNVSELLNWVNEDGDLLSDTASDLSKIIRRIPKVSFMDLVDAKINEVGDDPNLLKLQDVLRKQFNKPAKTPTEPETSATAGETAPTEEPTGTANKVRDDGGEDDAGMFGNGVNVKIADAQETANRINQAIANW